jgi:methylated-DNA-[protein]-cysteine S-methyltransferase
MTGKAGELRMHTTSDGFQARIAAPFGVIGVRTAGEKLVEIVYLPAGAATLAPVTVFAARVCDEIEAYLDDAAHCFDLPFEYAGSPFQIRVWRVVRSIPSGSTMTYSVVARRVHSAPRPVGMACGANRIPLVIPCHRVVASHGIGGFMHATRGPAIRVKRWLLEHEGALACH